MCARNARTRFLFFRRPLPNRLPRRRRTAAVRRSRFRLRHLPTGRPTQPQRPPYPPLLRRQRTVAQYLRRQRLLQEYTYKGSYEPLAQVFCNNQDKEQYLAYFHTDHIGTPREMTDIHGNLLWYGEYTAWGRLKKDERVYRNAHQPFRLQNQYFDEETGLHYNLMRYYEAETGRFINQDLIGLLGGENLYQFALNSLTWFDTLGLKVKILTYNHILKPDKVTDVKELKRQIRGQIRAFNKILKIEGLEGLQERIRNSRDDPTIEREEEGTQVIKDLQERVWYGYMNQICVQVVLPRVPIEKGKAEKIR